MLQPQSSYQQQASGMMAPPPSYYYPPQASGFPQYYYPQPQYGYQPQPQYNTRPPYPPRTYDPYGQPVDMNMGPYGQQPGFADAYGQQQPMAPMQMHQQMLPQALQAKAKGVAGADAPLGGTYAVGSNIDAIRIFILILTSSSSPLV